MFNISEIKTAFNGLIGWRQNPDGAGEQLSAGLLASSSGRYFNDAHPLLTIENLLSISPDIDNHLSTWLTEKTEAAILSTIYDWINKKAKLKTANTILWTSELYDREYNQVNEVLADAGILSGWVGFKIDIKQDNVKYFFTNFQTLLDDNTGTNSSQWKVIKLGDSSYIKDFTIQYPNTESFSITGKGSYLVCGYLPDWDSAPITGFENNTYTDNSLIRIRSIKMDSGETLINNFPTTTETANNWGAYFDITASCDFTKVLIDNKDLFIDAIFNRVGMEFLRELAFNPNAQVNRNEKNLIHEQLIYEIDGDTRSTPGNNNTLGSKYKQALKAILIDDITLNRLCLKSNRMNVNYRSVH